MVLLHLKRRLLWRIVSSSCAPSAAVHVGCVCAQILGESAWPTKESLTSTPEKQGMDWTALAALVAFGGSHSFDSLLVVRHGWIVLDAYYAPYTADIPHEIHSSTKAIVSTLVGMIYKDGLLRLR
jgi:CubicO group peptidase (beta-lactamase class C family)